MRYNLSGKTENQTIVRLKFSRFNLTVFYQVSVDLIKKTNKMKSRNDINYMKQLKKKR